MAKLEGVKTLDMVSGEVTKVEYGGAVYEKVDGVAATGDLLYCTDEIADTLADSFYEMVENSRGTEVFYDEVGDSCGARYTRHDTFRKVSALEAATLESVDERIDEIDAKVDALADRVDAVEKETGSQEIIEHDGKLLRKVSRRSKTGDYVRFPTGDLLRTSNWKLYLVVNGTEYHSEDGQLLDVYGWETSCPNPEIFEVTCVKEKPTLKEGDHVMTLKVGEFGDIEAGEVGEITGFHGYSDDDPYNVRVTVRGIVDYFRPQDLELVEDKNEGDADEDAWKKGDKVRNKATGKIVEVFAYKPKERTYGKGAGERLFWADEGFTYINSNDFEYWTRIDRFEKVEDKPEEAFKVGDLAKVVGESLYCDIEEGTIVRIIEDEDEDGDYKIELLDGSDYDFAKADALVKVSEEEAKPPYKPSEGDIVVITDNTNYSRNEIGDIGKVGRCVSRDLAEVDVPGKPSEGLVNGNKTKFSEVRPATDEEKAQYELAVKITKVGRKPDEFKKGDLGRVVRNYSASRVSVGDIVEVGRVYDSESIVDSKHNYILDIELIAPVESRVDVA